VQGPTCWLSRKVSVREAREEFVGRIEAVVHGSKLDDAAPAAWMVRLARVGKTWVAAKPLFWLTTFDRPFEAAASSWNIAWGVRQQV